MDIPQDENLTRQVSRLADALEKQQSFKRKFFSGIVLGVGTAIGASMIATIVILSLNRILSFIGIELPKSQSNDVRILQEEAQ